MVKLRMGRGGALMMGAVMLVGVGAIPGDLRAGLLLGLLTITSLLLHEGGHLCAARVLGVKVREIGVCLKGSYIRREQAQVPIDEFAISLSGPMINGLIAGVLWTASGVGHWLAIYNLVLMVSNLVPLPGSDGRRVLTALTRAVVRARIE